MKKQETKESYVYVLLDPTKPAAESYGKLTFDLKPFYVGKGIKTRAFSHVKAGEARALAGVLGSTQKERTIDRALRLGLTPKVVFVKTNLTDKQAVALEQKVLTFFMETCGLTNIRTTTWEGPPESKPWGPERKPVLTTKRLGQKTYYDTELNLHVIFDPTSAEVQDKVASGELLLCSGNSRRVRRKQVSVDPTKARSGSENGMFGKPSAVKGRKWFTVNGAEALLFPKDANKALKAGSSVVAGRVNYLKAAESAGSPRARGRRVIFEGELTGRYRVFSDVQGPNRKKRYQFGLVWSPIKPTYKNGKLLKG